MGEEKGRQDRSEWEFAAKHTGSGARSEISHRIWPSVRSSAFCLPFCLCRFSHLDWFAMMKKFLWRARLRSNRSPARTGAGRSTFYIYRSTSMLLLYMYVRTFESTCVRRLAAMVTHPMQRTNEEREREEGEKKKWNNDTSPIYNLHVRTRRQVCMYKSSLETLNYNMCRPSVDHKSVYCKDKLDFSALDQFCSARLSHTHAPGRRCDGKGSKNSASVANLGPRPTHSLTQFIIANVFYLIVYSTISWYNIRQSLTRLE